MNDTLIIGLAGRAGSGKDMVGEMLARHDFGRLAFAEPIRAMIFGLLNDLEIPADYMHERHLKEQPIPGLGVSYRQMAQTLGTEWGRDQLGQDFWVRAARRAIDQLSRHYDRIAYTDVRFLNEVEAIRSWGGFVVWVDRDQAAPVREHVSEQELTADHPDIYAHIDNSGTREETWEQVCRLVNRLEVKELES